MSQGAYIALFHQGYLGVVHTKQDGEVDKLGVKLHDTLTTVEDVEAVIEAGSVESFYLGKELGQQEPAQVFDYIAKSVTGVFYKLNELSDDDIFYLYIRNFNTWYVKFPGSEHSDIHKLKDLI